MVAVIPEDRLLLLYIELASVGILPVWESSRSLSSTTIVGDLATLAKHLYESRGLLNLFQAPSVDSLQTCGIEMMS